MDTLTLIANAFAPAPAARAIDVGFEAFGKHHGKHHHGKPAHSLAPFCPSIEGYGPQSLLRTFDLSPCFESAVVLVAPLVFLLVLGAIDAGRGWNRKGPWKERHGWSRIRLTSKVVR